DGRGDDAPGAAGADERRLLPVGAGVQPPLRPRPRPVRQAPRRRDRHAPAAAQPRPGDLGRGGRLPAVDPRRAGRQRRARPDGRALSPARRVRIGDRRWRVTTVLITGARVLGGPARDILIRDGVIAELGRLTGTAADLTVDADGLIALPGLVDLHTHLREPGREDAETIETGTQAAALGGFTAVHAMANTSPVADTAGVVEQVWRLGRTYGHCDVQPVGAVTAGLQGRQLAELGAMADSAARVRVFSDDGN